MAELTTVFTPASWCSNRFAVVVDNHTPGTSIIPPSSGWVDPSFTKCIPTQYTTTYPTFSPGVCPIHMQVVQHTFNIDDGKTIWTAGCCQSGFSPMSFDPGYLCTSTITDSMAFLLDPNISTADVYTTLAPGLMIEHDQVTVQWEANDLKHFPAGVASQYKVMMGITAPPSTMTADSETADSATSPANTNRPTLGPEPEPAPKTSVRWGTNTFGSTPESQTGITPTTTNDGTLLKRIWSAVFVVTLLAMGMYIIG
ncbi:hypothetical protein GGR55DRAFT_587198 [Xylaria sp. FL0064]|nr:hypothetical protein GGR55DRAFT_587198 [Xylaria sp. FL0064]